MTRLDARVKTELPAWAVSRAGGTEAVTLRDLSLGGVLVHGFQGADLSGEALQIRIDLPLHGEIDMQGQIVRKKESLTALRFFGAEGPSVSALWRHIKEKLPSAGLCPYCGRQNQKAQSLCQHCRMLLDFDDVTYLERHLRNTFFAKISDLVTGLNGARLQNLIGLIEREVARSRLPDTAGELVGRSPAMLSVFSLVERLARSDTNVLILGEPGTEKAWVARCLHQKSRRRLSPFVAVQTNRIPMALLDAELFGFNQGAFRQADRAQRGLLEAADGGAVFIDDIGALSPSLQAKLLGFLKDGIVERLGTRGGRRVDVRILAGAGEDFARREQRGRFVEEFLSSMDPEPVVLPPLRCRGEDRVLIAEHFLRKFARQKHKASELFDEDALEMIRSSAWPGNVAQLECCVKKGVSAARGKLVKKTDMSSGMRDQQPEKQSLRAAVSISERDAVTRALEESRYNISRAAKALEVSRPRLYALMRKYDLQKPDR